MVDLISPQIQCGETFHLGEIFDTLKVVIGKVHGVELITGNCEMFDGWDGE